jgi:hypothetical protein
MNKDWPRQADRSRFDPMAQVRHTPIRDELAREGYTFYAEEARDFAEISLKAVSEAIDSAESLYR